MSAAAETTEAILLRRSRFGETSLVLVWLSPAHGKLRTAARGAGRKDSKLRGRLDLFYHAEIHFAPGRKSDLHALREVRLLQTWDGLRTDYARLLAASYFAELSDLLSEPGHSAEGLFDLLKRALAHLDANLADAPPPVGLQRPAFPANVAAFLCRILNSFVATAFDGGRALLP